jgi:hypothetical protein
MEHKILLKEKIKNQINLTKKAYDEQVIYKKIFKKFINFKVFLIKRCEDIFPTVVSLRESIKTHEDLIQNLQNRLKENLRKIDNIGNLIYYEIISNEFSWKF